MLRPPVLVVNISLDEAIDAIKLSLFFLGCPLEGINSPSAVREATLRLSLRAGFLEKREKRHPQTRVPLRR